MIPALQLWDVLLNTREEHVIRSLLLRNMPENGVEGLGTQDLKCKVSVLVGEEHVDEKSLKEYHEEVTNQLYKWECAMTEGMIEPGLTPPGAPITYEGPSLRPHPKHASAEP